MSEFPNQQKVLYQRNLLLGQIAGILICVLASLFLFLNQDETVSMDTGRVLPIRLHLGKGPKTGAGLAPAVPPSVIAGKSPTEAVGRGDIQKDNEKPTRAVRQVRQRDDIGSILYSIKVTRMADAQMDSTTGWLNSRIGGDMVSVNSGSSLVGVGDGRFGETDLKPNFERELIIEFAAPQYPIKALGRSGFVTLALAIDERGRIDSCRVVQEIPPYLNFARSLINAVYFSRFKPPVMNGAELPVRLLLTYEFCWDCSTGSRVIAASEGIAVHIK